MKLPRVIRAYTPDRARTMPIRQVGVDHHAVVYGSDAEGSWSPPKPHSYQRAGIGDDPHAVRYAPEARGPSVAEQITNMITRTRA